MKEILVNEDGYQQFLEMLEELKFSLINSNSSKVQNDAVGDGWHDNFAYDEAMREERDVANKIKRMLKEKEYLKIVNDKYDDKLVNVGDIVELAFKYEDGTTERETVKLTGKYRPLESSDIEEISLNSPLGKAIYKRKFADNIIYKVNDIAIEVEIIKRK